jgi:hypothetical protein
MARTHMHGGVPCYQGYPSKKACDTASRLSLGQCSEMIEAKSGPYPCKNWAVEKVTGRGYCGQHIASVIRAEDDKQRKAKRRAEMDARIDEYTAWRSTHPSVWDKMARPAS